jgi:8-oxo-dGTP pyrophosphatase MutT (NUDIX family)
VIGNLGKLAKKLPYHGSGLLFASNGSGSWRVLLFQRAIRPRRGVWSIVGGRCKPGETYIQAAVREASEEICGRLPMLERFHGVLPEGFVLEQAKEHIQSGWVAWRPWNWCDDKREAYALRKKLVAWCGSSLAGILNVWPRFPSVFQEGRHTSISSTSQPP